MSDNVDRVSVAQIDPSPYQPRRRFDEAALEELAASIREHGVIQPLVLRPAGARYQVIAGERRLRAALKVGLRSIPAIIRPYTDEQALEAALIENLQREDLSVVEAAKAYQRLQEEFHYTQVEIAQRTGKNRATVNNLLRLLQLPESVLTLLDSGDLTEGHARALLTLPYPSLQEEFGEWIVSNALTVREAERKIRSMAEKEEHAPAASPAPPQKDVHLQDLEDRLRRHFGTKAGVSYRSGKGALTLEFYSDDDLQRLVELLGV